jgi:hypothetical protein
LVLLGLDVPLHQISTAQFLLEFLGLALYPSISFYAPLSPSALPLPSLSSRSSTPPFLVAHLSSPHTDPIACPTPFRFTAS